MRIYVRVISRTSQNKITKISNEEYRVKLTAPPVGGKANEMLIKILAKYFNVSKNTVQIIGGKSTKTKIIDIIL